MGDKKYSKCGWTSHPRPQFKRAIWNMLDTGWTVNAQPVRVPYPLQSELSGYEGEIPECFTYECRFVVPRNMTEELGSDCVLLNFGAVDQIADVYVNGRFIGRHEGGYLPFFPDITESVREELVQGGECCLDLLVDVKDELDEKYPYGKQSKRRGGMWYTPVSGIWQSVWLERVPKEHIEGLRITSDMEGVELEISGDVQDFTVVVKLPEDDSVTKHFQDKRGRLQIEGAVSDMGKPVKAQQWSVEEPKLYEMEIRAGRDVVNSYFALRTIEVKKINEVNRVCLNGKPVFMHGVLDQGYYQDGIYLPEDESEYEADILRMKELGFNMLRKHIKIEPESFYYACDRLGMLVVQDMVNNGPYSYVRDTVLPTIGIKRRKDVRSKYRDLRRRAVFQKHMKDTINHLYNHPCIVVYTIFNEGWGQFKSDKMYTLAKAQDPTRLYDSTSGWFAGELSDFDSEHIYFRNKRLKVKERPLFLSECGGFTYKVEGHCFNPNKTYGYGACKDSMELTRRIVSMYEKMVIPAIKDGLCGCVYTQLSDVEEEVNGMYTYDREVCKVDKAMMKELAKQLDV